MPRRDEAVLEDDLVGIGPPYERREPREADTLPHPAPPVEHLDHDHSVHENSFMYQATSASAFSKLTPDAASAVSSPSPRPAHDRALEHHVVESLEAAIAAEAENGLEGDSPLAHGAGVASKGRDLALASTHSVVRRLEVVAVELGELESIQLVGLEQAVVEPDLSRDELVGHEDVVIGGALMVHRLVGESVFALGIRPAIEEWRGPRGKVEAAELHPRG